jgi:hypothetical protein
LSFLVCTKDLVVRAESVVATEAAIEATKREVENDDYVLKSMILKVVRKKN